MISPGLFRKGPRPARAPRAHLALEPLESRTVPYSASGNSWPSPSLITLSFVPDGTNLGGQSSNLFATFNGDFGSASAWENAILKAAQTWAQQANINFAVVADDGSDSGSGSYQQGASNFGDIRVGGFDFGDSNVLAMAYMPPSVNNYSIAGDIAFNTAQVFNINGLDYDLYTVALHEMGHALGLNHSTSSAAIMYPIYTGIEYGLNTDDVSGVQSIYGARVPDAYEPNNSFAAAANVTSALDPTALSAALNGLSINTTSQKDYFSVTAPSGGSGSLALTVQSAGLSLLAPSVKVYDANQHLLASAVGSGDLGSTLSLNVSVTAGQTYYVRVGAANTTAFGTGAYGITLNFGTGASPALSPPNTQTANGSPLSGGGGLADHIGGGDDSDQLTIGDIHSEARPVTAAPAAAPPAVLAPAPVIAPAAVVLTPGRAALLTAGPARTDVATTARFPDPSVPREPHAAAVVVEAPLPAPVSAPAEPASQDDDAGAPAPAPALPAEPEVRDSYFSASDWREDGAASALAPHAAETAEPAAFAAAVVLALAPAAESRRRPSLSR